MNLTSPINQLEHEFQLLSAFFDHCKNHKETMARDAWVGFVKTRQQTINSIFDGLTNMLYLSPSVQMFFRELQNTAEHADTMSEAELRITVKGVASIAKAMQLRAEMPSKL